MIVNIGVTYLANRKLKNEIFQHLMTEKRLADVMICLTSELKSPGQ